MNRLRKHLYAALEARLNGQKVRTPDAFLALSRARSCGPHRPNRISWEALAAWSQVMRVPIRPDHAEIIMALDDVRKTRTIKRAPDGVKTPPPMSKHPLRLRAQGEDRT